MLGHFRIEKEIAQGGAASIYLAENTKTGENIALKIIHDHLRKRVSFRKRLKREVKFISEIKSEHLIEILSSGEIDDKLYIEMEYFCSVTLNEWVKTER